jgi:glycosyltransferase involved in cell wall biosynthesis
MRNGVAISTFNRPDFLDITLWHWNKYSSENTDIYVVDDGSNKKQENEEVCKKYPRIKLIYQENQGISKTKTRGLSELKNHDYIFLSDDDCFPIKYNYEDVFIKYHLSSNNHHFIYLIDRIREHVIHGDKHEVFPGIESYQNCGGMLLFATKYCVNTIGGFDNRMKFYGYEHAQWTSKVFSSGLNPHGKHLCPTEALDYFFTIDFHRGWLGMTPEYWNPDIVMQSSITTTDEKKNSYLDSISYNSQYMNDLNFYTPL